MPREAKTKNGFEPKILCVAQDHLNADRGVLRTADPETDVDGLPITITLND